MTDASMKSDVERLTSALKGLSKDELVDFIVNHLRARWLLPVHPQELALQVRFFAVSTRLDAKLKTLLKLTDEMQQRKARAMAPDLVLWHELMDKWNAANDALTKAQADYDDVDRALTARRQNESVRR